MTNLVEILKNAPKGLELYSPIYGKVTLSDVQPYSVYVKCESISSKEIMFDEYGRKTEKGECLLFPSKEHRNWDTWQKILFKPNYFITITGLKYNLTIKVQQYGWKDESKNTRFATTEEIENWYRKNNLFKSEDCIAESLVEFTIDDFKPFDKVLVRTDNNKDWLPRFYDSYTKMSNGQVLYTIIGTGAYAYSQCIPYNDETKHLLGTSEEYNGKYKTW